MRRSVMQQEINWLSSKLSQLEVKIGQLENERDSGFVPGWYVLYNDLPSEENGGISAVGYFKDAGEYYRIRSRWTYSVLLLDGGIVSKLFAKGKT